MDKKLLNRILEGTYKNEDIRKILDSSDRELLQMLWAIDDPEKFFRIVKIVKKFKERGLNYERK